MKTITLRRKNVDLKGFVKRSAETTDCSLLVREPAVIVDEETKAVVAIYGKLATGGHALAQRLKAVKYQVTERTGGIKTVSRIFGAMPRIALRSDFCRKTTFSQEDPTTAKLLEEYGAEASKLYREYSPERYARHKELMNKVLPEYRMTDLVFTSGIINKNNPLKYHYDAGNFDDVFSCMVGFKDGVTGGYLAMPEYDCALEIGNGSVTLFDGQSILHGVTPIVRMRDDATRFTVVFYSLKQMWNCKPLNEELARIRQLKTERERKRAKHV